MNTKIMEKIQRFGGAMYTPVLLFTFPGLLIGISSIFQNQGIMGEIAAKSTVWYQFWFMIKEGAQTVFRQMSLIFVLALPIGLAKKQSARCALEALVTYITFNYFLSALLTSWGPTFNLEFSKTATLSTIMGIKTLDTGIIGAFVISGIVVILHDKYYEKNLPEWLGVFKGSAFIYVLSFFCMIPTAIIFAFIWPKIQVGFTNMQNFFMNTEAFGVFSYTTLSRILIPTGLHHFIYMPFNYGDAIVQGGLKAFWSLHMAEFATYQGPLGEIFPEGRFLSLGYAKIFGSPGIAAAFYFTAKKENRKKVLALILPVTLTAVVAGITEPIEFTFLFIAPFLFVVHSLLAGAIAAVEYIFGVVSGSAGNLTEFMLMNWIPLWPTQHSMFIKQIIIGLCFTFIWFIVFYFLILKFDIKTPGREDENIKLYSKKDYKEKNNKNTISKNEIKEMDDKNLVKAKAFLEFLGGKDNIKDVTNCATRLRVSVLDNKLVADTEKFKSVGAHGVVRNGNAFQIIVGLDVSIVRDRFEKLLENKNL